MMNKRYLWIALSALAVGLVGCGAPETKEDPKAATTGETTTPTDTKAVAPSATETKPTDTNAAKPDAVAPAAKPGAAAATEVKPDPAAAKAPKTDDAKAEKPAPPRTKPGPQAAPRPVGEVPGTVTATPTPMTTAPEGAKKPPEPKKLVNYVAPKPSGNASSFKGHWVQAPSPGLQKMIDQAKAKGNKPLDIHVDIDGAGGYIQKLGARTYEGVTQVKDGGIVLNPTKINGKTPTMEAEVRPQLFKMVNGQLVFFMNGKASPMKFKRG